MLENHPFGRHIPSHGLDMGVPLPPPSPYQLHLQGPSDHITKCTDQVPAKETGDKQQMNDDYISHS